MSADPRLDVTLDGEAAVDVVVVAVDRRDDAAIAMLRRPAGESAKPKVMVAGEIDRADSLELADCRVSAVLPRQVADHPRLAQSVMDGLSRSGPGGGSLAPHRGAQ